MNFRIADSFTDSLSRLSAQEQKAVKTTVFDLQADPSTPGLKLHRIDRSKDDRFWSLRVNRDLRIVVHKSASSMLLCHVAHHDDAYKWAERRRIEKHPKTGAAQIVEVRERVEEIAPQGEQAPASVEERRDEREADYPRPFASLSQDDILGVGVPEDWVQDIRQCSEDGFFELADHLPAEAAEVLLNYAASGVLRPSEPSAVELDPFDHPDAQRRFRVLENREELERALDYPWERWTVFLHPAQRSFVERDYNGPARVAGSAGTGKTVVALHRAVRMARKHPDASVLLTTFSPTLANALKIKLHRLVGNEAQVHERITVRAIDTLGLELHERLVGPTTLASEARIEELLRGCAKEASAEEFNLRFLMDEWRNVVDAWQLRSWEDYKNVSRLGRKKRLGGRQRELLWEVFECLRGKLAEEKLLTMPQVFSALGEALDRGEPASYDFAVIDEAQDVGVAELAFLAKLGAGRPNALFFSGDLGQRIFQQPFSWKELGVDVRGRSNTLRVNYRTSHQIRALVDGLLPPALADVDGNEESRMGTLSVFNGPDPEIAIVDSEEEEIETVATWLQRLQADGVSPNEIGIFVRHEDLEHRIRAAVEKAGLTCFELTQDMDLTERGVAIGTMHLAKGLEFRAVAVMACDDEVLPLQSRIEAVSDTSDLDDVYDTERHLLYVACTRARDYLLVTGVEPASEFLDDLRAR
ncbi:MAG: 3'-5' exonuclease [Rhodovibrionaceae bacterium]